MIREFVTTILARLHRYSIFREMKGIRELKQKSWLFQKIYYDWKILPFYIAIDNTTACNRKCPYCPYFWTPIKRQLMPLPVYRKIINDLGDAGYAGSLIFGPWSEPLLDDRLPSLIQYARSRLGDAQIVIQTNGDLLTWKLFKQLSSAGADEFDVSDHYAIVDNRFVIDESKHAIETYLLLSNTEKKLIHFHDNNYKRIRRLDYFHNRTGLVPLKAGVSFKDLYRTCDTPDGCLSINYRGDVLLCCRQWTDFPVYGNVMDEHVKDIWEKPEFKRIRKNLRNGLFELEICKNCGFGHLPDPSEIYKLRKQNFHNAILANENE